MTSEPVRDPVTDALLTPQNAALVVIDYQPSQVQTVASIDHDLLTRNIVSVARLAKTYGLPIVLSTVNVKTGRNAPTIHQLREILPDVEALDYDVVEAEVTARDREVANRYTKDSQITAIRGARAFLSDRISRVVAPHRLTDPKAGPLIAVKLHILTRKSLGGLETDLDSRVLTSDGSVFGGLYAAGEAAGFGGGGVHGYRSLEGTFLGGCVFSGRAAGRAAARDV